MVRTCEEKVEGDDCEEKSWEPEGIIEEEVAHECVEYSEDTRNAAQRSLTRQGKRSRVGGGLSVRSNKCDNVPSPQGPP